SVIGARNVLTHPHNLELAAAFIEKSLSDLGLAVATQPYKVMNGTPVRNIDAQQDGISAADQVVVVGSHYDSIAMLNDIGCPGANDNGSGVAATLEIARLL